MKELDINKETGLLDFKQKEVLVDNLDPIKL